MPQITLYAQTNNMNWDAANGWNAVSGGGGTAYTNPQNAANTFICDLNGKTVVANQDISVDKIQASTGVGGNLSVTAAARMITVNGGLLNSAFSNAKPLIYGTGTNGGVGAGQTLTLQSTSASAYVAYNYTGGGGIAIVDGGAMIVSNPTGMGCIFNSYGVSGDAFVVNSGSFTVNGVVYGYSNNGYGITCNGGTTIVNGDLHGGYLFNVRVNGGTLTINGNIYHDAGNTWHDLLINGGAVNWTGGRSLTAGSFAWLFVQGGTLNLATATAALTLTNAGSIAITLGNGNVVTSAAGGSASIINASATAQACVMGAAIVTGPLLPNKSNVLTGTGNFGYSTNLQTPSLTLPAVGSVFKKHKLRSGRKRLGRNARHSRPTDNGRIRPAGHRRRGGHGGQGKRRLGNVDLGCGRDVRRCVACGQRRSYPILRRPSQRARLGCVHRQRSLDPGPGRYVPGVGPRQLHGCQHQSRRDH